MAAVTAHRGCSGTATRLCKRGRSSRRQPRTSGARGGHLFQVCAEAPYNGRCCLPLARIPSAFLCVAMSRKRRQPQQGSEDLSKGKPARGSYQRAVGRIGQQAPNLLILRCFLASTAISPTGVGAEGAKTGDLPGSVTISARQLLYDACLTNQYSTIRASPP